MWVYGGSERQIEINIYVIKLFNKCGIKLIKLNIYLIQFVSCGPLYVCISSTVELFVNLSF